MLCCWQFYQISTSKGMWILETIVCVRERVSVYIKERKREQGQIQWSALFKGSKVLTLPLRYCCIYLSVSLSCSLWDHVFVCVSDLAAAKNWCSSSGYIRSSGSSQCKCLLEIGPYKVINAKIHTQMQRMLKISPRHTYVRAQRLHLLKDTSIISYNFKMVGMKKMLTWLHEVFQKPSWWDSKPSKNM